MFKKSNCKDGGRVRKIERIERLQNAQDEYM